MILQTILLAAQIESEWEPIIGFFGTVIIIIGVPLFLASLRSDR